jgi:uncharacterized protein involved in type VI secretion and phage assembly
MGSYQIQDASSACMIEENRSRTFQNQVDAIVEQIVKEHTIDRFSFRMVQLDENLTT